jgi:hypothetical protein
MILLIVLADILFIMALLVLRSALRLSMEVDKLEDEYFKTLIL